ncbi:histidinol-phosphate transaminase [Helicobacter sp. MIT 14-3879]|uniref:histidinol-phosphate transaminase n=1 Tax=Helicobacter sp. MIT 14-3879 TaxID=2040649 RepID=UPI000E1FA1DB|nr:histidinol-phosphate transaminase [Helicobacter sp. MIT 14-3879]RDU62268.1 histidinol-phosphate transaminase [Helicobacter sp. MIT 14-3879]
MGFKKYLDKLVCYEAGKPIELVVRDYGIYEDDIIKLASNENPLGTPKSVIKAIKKEAKNAFRYPDDSAFELKEALSKKYRIYPSNIIIGSGSDQIIDIIIKAICNKDTKILMSSTTFAMYEIYAKQNEANIIRTKSGIHNMDEFINEYNTIKPSLVFLCLPNNPLGDCLSKDEVYKILDSVSKDCIVALDCAYNEFAKYKDKSKAIIPNELIEKYQNVVYLGTFSKLYALGGMRVGYGIATDSIIKTLSKLRPPFNITNISLKAALTAIKDKKFVEKTLKNNFKEMEVYEEFAKENNIKFIDSYTNFITFIFDDMLDSTALTNYLLKNGVIIRDLKSYRLNAIRITIGTKEQNKRVLKLISKYLHKVI